MKVPNPGRQAAELKKSQSAGMTALVDIGRAQELGNLDPLLAWPGTVLLKAASGDY